MIEAWSEATLIPIVERALGHSATGCTVIPLEGGITNRNFLVQTGGQELVVRVPGQTTLQLGIDREAEYRASIAAARVGVGPEVIAFVQPEGCLVTRFIDGGSLEETQVRQPEMIRAIAHALLQVHTSAQVSTTFSPFEVVEQYAERAGQVAISQFPQVNRCRHLMTEVRASFGSGLDLGHLCHNDLLTANFLLQNGRIRIVDWEYAGMGSIHFDLGNLSINNGYQDEQDELLLRAYFGSLRQSDWAALKLMRIASDGREAMWGVLQSVISDLDFDFAGYAHEHFERMFQGGSGRTYRRLLSTVSNNLGGPVNA